MPVLAAVPRSPFTGCSTAQPARGKSGCGDVGTPQNLLRRQLGFSGTVLHKPSLWCLQRGRNAKQRPGWISFLPTARPRNPHQQRYICIEQQKKDYRKPHKRNPSPTIRNKWGQNQEKLSLFTSSYSSMLMYMYIFIYSRTFVKDKAKRVHIHLHIECACIYIYMYFYICI